MDEMNESLNTEQVTEDSGTVVEAAGEENSQTEEGSEDAKDAETAELQKEQTRKTNAMMAAARRQAERETRERMEREQDEKIAAMRIPDPTKPGEYFKTVADMEAYSKALKRSNAEKRAEREKRDVSEILEEDENREYLSRKRREEQAKNETKNNDRQEFICRDIEDFRGRFPDVDIAKLDTNKAFRRFAGSRYGVEPLGDLYEDFVEVVGTAKAAESARRSDREERSTGSGTGGKAVSLTREQQKLLDRWNEEYPEMKMSAKEFLDRK